MRLISPCSVTSSTSTNASVLVASVGGPRVARPRGDLERAELHRFPDRRIEGDGAAGDFIEAGKYRPAVVDLLRRRHGDDRIVLLRRGIGRLRRRRVCRAGALAAPCGDGGGGGAALAGTRGGACDAPGGGGSGCAWIPDGARATGFCGGWYCCGGGYCCCDGYCPGYCTGGGWDGKPPFGTSAGGRGGESLKRPNCAAAGRAASVPPITTRSAAIRSMKSCVAWLEAALRFAPLTCRIRQFQGSTCQGAGSGVANRDKGPV